MKTTRTVLLISLVLVVNAVTIFLVIYNGMYSSFEGEEGARTGKVLTSILYNVVSNPYVYLALLVLATGLAIGCCVFALKTYRAAAMDEDYQRGLYWQVFVYKLLLIPYFACFTLLVLVMLLAMAVMAISIWFTIPAVMGGGFIVLFSLFMSFFNYLLMLATSSFSISAINIEYRNLNLSRAKRVVFIILQLLPLVDVVSYPFIIVHIKNTKKSRQLSISPNMV